MTKEYLNDHFGTIFQHFFCYQEGGESFLAATNAFPRPGAPAFAFIPYLDDFKKIEVQQITLVVRSFNVFETITPK